MLAQHEWALAWGVGLLGGDPSLGGPTHPLGLGSPQGWPEGQLAWEREGVFLLNTGKTLPNLRPGAHQYHESPLVFP